MAERIIISDLATDPQVLDNDDLLRVTSTGELDVDGTAVQILSSSDDAQVIVQAGGSIDGSFNGVYFENGGESSGRLINRGDITSDSRAVNIGGEDISVLNTGNILGTGDQRNGTIYADGSANDYRITNTRQGVIDAGAGNQGAAISLQTGDTPGDVAEGRITNSGVIQGRGQAEASSPLAGDGIRIFSGSTESTTFEGQISNFGHILSESAQGTTGAIRITDGLNFDGNIINGRSGEITGVQNGIYVGVGEHDLNILNLGLISSDSRAVNIDGSGVDLINSGTILGTGDQRNGLIYSDGSADDYSIVNTGSGLIDVGEGNQGAAIALQIGIEVDGVVNASIRNDGEIIGRGQAEASSLLAGDGIRLVSGVLDENTIFEGDITNSGTIISESAQGATGAIRVADDVSFVGDIVNTVDGQIVGVQNGVYIGEADHDLTIRNRGLVSSDSRAINIDGSGVDLINFGSILGTGDQRNGLIYSDGSADDYSIRNAPSGLIDVGEGNQGAAIALQTGVEVGDVVNARISNHGDIIGRGQAESSSNLAGDGIRIVSGVPGENTIFQGDIRNFGTIFSESAQGTTGAIRLADNLSFEGEIFNSRSGEITGVQNAIYVGVGEHDLTIQNLGLISSDSRAVNIDGSGVDLINEGDIIGTGDQRNGLIYSDGSADDYSIINTDRGLIDVGEGNQGAAIALQIGVDVGDVVNASIQNDGEIIGRGQAAASSNLAGDGIRLVSGVLGDNTIFEGDIENSGTIVSESAQGATGAIRVADDVSFVGEIINDVDGVIEGVQNGVYIGEAEHDLTIRNRGLISSDSRAVNIDGSGVDLINTGTILGTGDQRNGLIYSDGSANDYSIRNSPIGLIDVGEGNQGAAIALQTGVEVGDVVNARISNHGDIIGRGQAESSSNLAGDGIRVVSGVPGENTIFQGDIRNFGTIFSESGQGTTGAIRLADNLSFEGEIFNSRSGEITGVQNAIYVGVGEHDLSIRNLGLISSDSRAVNIDGSGVDLTNSGTILGTGDQRNGLIYSDGSADDYSIVNTGSGLIDVGEGNQGAAIAFQIGVEVDDVVNASIQNAGDIIGRGQAAASSTLAGDGIRLVSGVLGENTIFEGTIENSGSIISESAQGATGAIRIANDVSFVGEIVNEADGSIEGVQNGLYVGTGEHELTIRNEGLISSDSRAVNIDGSGVDLINSGTILGTGDQRNGTIYADATAEVFNIVNLENGLVDAGEGNQGAGISLQIGDEAGDVVEFVVGNFGEIIGRGDAPADSNLAGDGIRLFSGVPGEAVIASGNIVNRGSIEGTNSGITVAEDVTLKGAIRNFGTIAAADGIGVVIDGEISGSIFNEGEISGTVAAINAEGSESDIRVVNRGLLDGEVILSNFDDVLIGTGGVFTEKINGLDGNDRIIGGSSSDLISGGIGNDTLSGNRGADIFIFEDLQPGDDVITDFRNGDQLDVSDFNLGASGLEALIGNAQQVGNDVLLELQSSQSVLLQNTQLANLDEGDFIS